MYHAARFTINQALCDAPLDIRGFLEVVVARSLLTVLEDLALQDTDRAQAAPKIASSLRPALLVRPLPARVVILVDLPP